MAGSSFGQAFRVTTAGESHGPGNVVIIDGCPPGIPLSVEDLLVDLDRRKPGQSRVTTQRQESDTPEILAGVFEGETTGTSIAILVRNEDQKSRDYADIKDKYRPGHADYTFDAKYGRRDYRGGGRSSARETVSRVAAGVIAKKILARANGTEIVGYVKQVGDIVGSVDPNVVTLRDVETLPNGEPNIVRCPDAEAAGRMIALIDKLRKELDSIGGVGEIVARNVPPGLGEPVFDKLKADLAKGLFSLPAVLGGMLGGISSGEPIILRAAVKPTSSLPQAQRTVTTTGEATTISTKGRHDPCLLPRFVPMAEAMVAIVLADHYLRQRAQNG
jgi:chorismate synthase